MISQDERKDYETFISRIVPNSIFADLSTEANLSVHDACRSSHRQWKLYAFSGSAFLEQGCLHKLGTNESRAKGLGILGRIEYFPDGLTADSYGNLLHHVSEVRARFSSERLGVKLKLSAMKKYFDDSFPVF